MYILPQRMHSSCGSPANIDINSMDEREKERKKNYKKSNDIWVSNLSTQSRMDYGHNNEKYYGMFSLLGIFFCLTSQLRLKQQKQNKKCIQSQMKENTLKTKVLVGCCITTTYNANRLICVYGNIIHVRERYYTYVTVWPTQHYGPTQQHNYSIVCINKQFTRIEIP